MAIQLDFGGFDPAFIGVTLKLANARAWEYFNRITKDKQLAALSGLSPSERFEAISIASVASHEFRHFHDFLLTPYSARIFKCRIQAVLNELQLLPWCVREGANCLPVPLPTWCGLDDARRQEALSWFGPTRDGSPWRPVALPYLADPMPLGGNMRKVAPGQDHIAPLLRASAAQRTLIRELSFNPQAVSGETSLQPWQIYELSGLLIQVQDIYIGYGLGAAREFIAYLDAQKKNPYSQIFRLAHSIWDHGDTLIDTRKMSAVATWALLGSYEKDGWKACPATRFAYLWKHLRTKGWKSDVVDSAELMHVFNQWSAALKLSTVSDGLDETVRVFDRLNTTLSSHLRNPPEGIGGSRFQIITDVAADVAKAARHMTQRFKEDPAAYVAPEAYLENLSRFVNAPMRIEIENGGVRWSRGREELHEKGFRFLWTTDDGDRPLVMSYLAPSVFSTHEYLDREQAAELFDLICVTDFLFAADGRARGDLRRTANVFFKESAVQPREIM